MTLRNQALLWENTHEFPIARAEGNDLEIDELVWSRIDPKPVFSRSWAVSNDQSILIDRVVFQDTVSQRTPEQLAADSGIEALVLTLREAIARRFASLATPHLSFAPPTVEDRRARLLLQVDVPSTVAGETPEETYARYSALVDDVAKVVTPEVGRSLEVCINFA
ncbi:MAG: hypothetical protein ACYC7F_06385 [Gemmatimonadaceae bacterium]